MSRHCQRWTSTEIEQLKQLYQKPLTCAQIGRRLDRSSGAVYARVRKLRLTSANRGWVPWSKQETQKLIQLVEAGALTRSAIANKLGRTRRAVDGKIFGLRKQGVMAGRTVNEKLSLNHLTDRIREFNRQLGGAA